MASIGDKVVLIGTIRAVDGDNTLVVVGANGNHLFRVETADVIEEGDHASLSETGTQSFLGLIQFLGSSPPGSGNAAVAGTDLLRLNEFDVGQLAQNVYLIGLLIGYQPLDSHLTGLALVNPARDEMVYYSGTDAAAVIATLAFGRGLLNLASAAALRAAAEVTKVGVLKAIGSSTGSVQNVALDVPWSAAEITHSELSISGAEITVSNAGTKTYDISCTVRTISNNRTELSVQIYKDTGSGFVAMTSEITSDYVSRDSDQDTGAVTLCTALALDDGDKIKFEAYGDCDGTCTLLTAGTILKILGPY